MIERRKFNLDSDGPEEDSHTFTFNPTPEGIRWVNEYWDHYGIVGEMRNMAGVRNLHGGIAPKHWLATKDALIALEAYAWHRHMDIVQWADYDLIRRVLKSKDKWSQSWEPDGFIVFRNQNFSLAALVEVDMGTEELDADAPSSWRSKTYKIVDFINSWHIDPHCSSWPTPVILVLCPTPHRAQSVGEVLLKYGARSMVWVGLQEWTRDPTTFYDRKWTALTSQPRSLFDKLFHDGRQSRFQGLQ